MCEVCGGDCKLCINSYIIDTTVSSQQILNKLYEYGKDGYGIKDILTILCKASSLFLTNHLKDDNQFDRYVNQMKDYYISYKAIDEKEN